VEIRPEGWRIVARPSLRFLRGEALEALPIPTPGQGAANLLCDFLNVETEDDFRLLIAWLIGCLHPTSLIDPARPAPSSEGRSTASPRPSKAASSDASSRGP
jgi:hypothetical protein